MSSADRVYDNLESLKGLSCKRNVLLSTLTSFGVGGHADLLAVAEDIEGLRSMLKGVAATDTRWFVLGAGTNVIFTDSGFAGVILKLGSAFGSISREGAKIFAGASALWSDLMSFCAKHSLSGLERMAGIPGTVGGAAAGNAGSFGINIGDRISLISGVSGDGTERSLLADQIEFRYRYADFGANFVLTEITLSLEPGQETRISAEMDEVLAARKERQPLEFPSAGSIFKNPPDMKAAKLIEDAGLKGKGVGGAEISALHANFIINRGGASASDILSLVEIVREEVWKRFSVRLELEIKVIR